MDTITIKLSKKAIKNLIGIAETEEITPDKVIERVLTWEISEENIEELAGSGFIAGDGSTPGDFTYVRVCMEDIWYTKDAQRALKLRRAKGA